MGANQGKPSRQDLIDELDGLRGQLAAEAPKRPSAPQAILIMLKDHRFSLVLKPHFLHGFKTVFFSVKRKAQHENHLKKSRFR